MEVYRKSRAYAIEHGEIESYRQSHKLNVECRDCIDECIAECFDGMHLNKLCIRRPIYRFGVDRVLYVLAATVQDKLWDDRFSGRSKTFAKAYAFPDQEVAHSFCCTTHPAVLNGFIGLVRDWSDEHDEIPEEELERRYKLAAEDPHYEPDLDWFYRLDPDYE